jgi:uncharacterized coiled-coil DUF342 family protein
MDKTKVDDMLIEMITPKVKQIEEKFGNGEGLSQDDINTLLLKAQYNHINHLDQKLDETTASVENLKQIFSKLENKFDGKFNKFDGKFSELENKFDLLNEKIATTIQTALNKNMMFLITIMGSFVVLSKIIDKF